MVSGPTLRPAVLADLNAIKAIERTPGFERFVGRSREGEHRAMTASSNCADFVGEAADAATAAFAVLRDLEDARGDLYLKRIALARSAEGVGAASFGLLVAWAFTHAAARDGEGGRDVSDALCATGAYDPRLSRTTSEPWTRALASMRRTAGWFVFRVNHGAAVA